MKMQEVAKMVLSIENIYELCKKKKGESTNQSRNTYYFPSNSNQKSQEQIL